MKCLGCGFPFPPHELRMELCFDCVWKEFVKVRMAYEEALHSKNLPPEWLSEALNEGDGTYKP